MLPNPVLNFGSVHIYMYGIMIALGILACFFVLFQYGKWAGIGERYIDFAFYSGIVSIVVGFFGAALWQAIFNYIEDVQNGVKDPEFDLNGGITAIGGLVTGALTYILLAIIFRKKYPYMLTKTVTIAPCCMVIAHAFGRIGCFCAGCCYGKEATGFWSFLGVKFVGGEGAGVLRYPTNLFEAVFLFALFAVMSYLLLKKKFKYNIVVYLASYGTWRFLIEFLRDDHRGQFLGALSPSQTQSIVLVLLAIPAFFLMRYYLNKMKLAEEASGASDDAVVNAESVETEESKEGLKNEVLTSKVDNSQGNTACDDILNDGNTDLNENLKEGKNDVPSEEDK